MDEIVKAFSVVSWNVEHFRNPDSRVDRVVDFLNDHGPPDVFALYEVEGKEVFGALVAKMPGYTFHITEGRAVQEILVGVAPHITGFFTQKTEFQSQVAVLRPGALLTVTVNDVSYPLLFLHTKSGVDPIGLGLRDDMLNRALAFRRVLDEAAGADGKANYIFMGDLNTMGMEYMFLRDRDIAPEQEIDKLTKLSAARDMRVLNKDVPATWWNAGASLPPSNLDHVVAADHLEFTQFTGTDVTVLGWPKLATELDQKDWIDSYSDHGMLYFEVHEPT